MDDRILTEMPLDELWAERGLYSRVEIRDPKNELEGRLRRLGADHDPDEPH